MKPKLSPMKLGLLLGKLMSKELEAESWGDIDPGWFQHYPNDDNSDATALHELLVRVATAFAEEVLK